MSLKYPIGGDCQSTDSIHTYFIYRPLIEWGVSQGKEYKLVDYASTCFFINNHWYNLPYTEENQECANFNSACTLMIIILIQKSYGSIFNKFQTDYLQIGRTFGLKEKCPKFSKIVFGILVPRIPNYFFTLCYFIYHQALQGE